MHKFTFVMKPFQALNQQYSTFTTTQEIEARAFWILMESSPFIVFCEWETPNGKVENVFDR